MSDSLLTPIEQYIVDFVIDLRTKKKLGQEDIAKVIGKTQSFVAAIENSKKRAKYNLNHINLLAEHFGLSPRDFLPKKPL